MQMTLFSTNLTRKRVMQRLMFVLVMMIGVLSCKSDDPITMASNSTTPPPSRTILKTGVFTGQNGYATSGGVDVVRDSSGAEFVVTKSDFRVSGGAGTITAWLTDATGAGNLNSSSVKLQVGTINSGFAGVYAFPVQGAMASSYSHIVMFCQSARINFGNAPLQNP